AGPAAQGAESGPGPPGRHRWKTEGGGEVGRRLLRRLRRLARRRPLDAARRRAAAARHPRRGGARGPQGRLGSLGSLGLLGAATSRLLWRRCRLRRIPCGAAGRRRGRRLGGAGGGCGGGRGGRVVLPLEIGAAVAAEQLPVLVPGSAIGACDHEVTASRLWGTCAGLREETRASSFSTRMLAPGRGVTRTCSRGAGCPGRSAPVVRD